MIGARSFSAIPGARRTSPNIEGFGPLDGDRQSNRHISKTKAQLALSTFANRSLSIPIHGAVGETRRVEHRGHNGPSGLFGHSPVSGLSGAPPSAVSGLIDVPRGNNVNHASLTRGGKLLASLALGTALA